MKWASVPFTGERSARTTNVGERTIGWLQSSGTGKHTVSQSHNLQSPTLPVTYVSTPVTNRDRPTTDSVTQDIPT